MLYLKRTLLSVILFFVGGLYVFPQFVSAQSSAMQSVVSPVVQIKSYNAKFGTHLAVQ